MTEQNQHHILIADDESAITEALSDLLQMEGYTTSVARNGKQALDLIGKEQFELMLVDLMLPDVTGLEILEEIKKQGLSTEVIIITGKGTIDTAVEAMKAGAYDYLTKPVEPNRLRSIVPRALEHQNLRKTNKQLQKTIEKLSGFEDMIGEHEKMVKVYQLIESVADTTANVFITGESGTGKELVARAIHRKSGRRDGPFVAVNCSALPGEILENELFGHEKGAFTGALDSKAGCFEMANSGTLFLDEIGDMPANIQSKLLRALEERTFRRLGGSKEITVDVRVIAATNRDVQKAMKEGTLREDLYFRLSVVDIDLPPLRERMSDLNPLLEKFLAAFNEKNNKNVTGFSRECLDLFRKYQWPGNVRELKNLVERAVILCDGDTIELHHLPKHIFQFGEAAGSESVPAGKPLHEIEKQVIFKTLEQTDQNKTKAAQLLGISLKTLHNKLNKYYSEEAD